MDDGPDEPSWQDVSRWGPKEGEQAIESWRASGLSQSAWCIANGVKQHRLSYWHSRLRSRSEGPEPLGFMRIVQQQTAAIQVTVADGAASISVAPGFDPSLLRSVVEALR